MDVRSRIGSIEGCTRIFCSSWPSRYTVTLDGTKLSAAPQAVGSYLLCQSTTSHSFQLEVPVTAPAGAISPRLNFQAILQ